MSDTDRLRDLLEQTAPHSPDVTAPERTAAVVRRGRAARTRDRALVGAAAAAVLAIGVLVPVLRGGDDARHVTPAPSPPATVAAPCPSAPVDVATLGAVPALDDVVAVRSCPTTEKPVTALPTRPLVDADAAAFLADVAATPDYEMPAACMVMSMAIEPWALQLQTTEGRTVLVGSTMRGCSSVTFAGADRGVDQVLAAFLGNLRGAPDSLACPTDGDLTGLPTWNASFDPRTAVAGRICNGSSETDLSADETAVIGEDLAGHLDAGPDDAECYDPPRGDLVLLLADESGDQVAYVGQTCTTQLVGPRGYWAPGPVASELLNRSRG